MLHVKDQQGLSTAGSLQILNGLWRILTEQTGLSPFLSSSDYSDHPESQCRGYLLLAQSAQPLLPQIFHRFLSFHSLATSPSQLKMLQHLQLAAICLFFHKAVQGRKRHNLLAGKGLILGFLAQPSSFMEGDYICVTLALPRLLRSVTFSQNRG